MGDLVGSDYYTKGSDLIPIPTSMEEPIREYKFIRIKNTVFNLIEQINENAKRGWRLDQFVSEKGAVMSRRADSKNHFEKIEMREAAVVRNIKELQDRGSSVSAREKAAAEKEAKLEKIRMGMIEEGSFGVDKERVHEMLMGMDPKNAVDSPTERNISRPASESTSELASRVQQQLDAVEDRFKQMAAPTRPEIEMSHF